MASCPAIKPQIDVDAPAALLPKSHSYPNIFAPIPETMYVRQVHLKPTMASSHEPNTI